MAALKHPRILFFINGPVPSDEEAAQAELLGFNVAFRNALHVPSEGALEACDGVAGKVPSRYEASYPSAEEALSAWTIAREKRAVLLQEGVKSGEGVTHGAKEETASESQGKGKKAASVVWAPNKDE